MALRVQHSVTIDLRGFANRIIQRPVSIACISFEDAAIDCKIEDEYTSVLRSSRLSWLNQSIRMLLEYVQDFIASSVLCSTFFQDGWLSFHSRYGFLPCLSSEPWVGSQVIPATTCLAFQSCLLNSCNSIQPRPVSSQFLFAFSI